MKIIGIDPGLSGAIAVLTLREVDPSIEILLLSKKTIKFLSFALGFSFDLLKDPKEDLLYMVLGIQIGLRTRLDILVS